MSDYPTTIPRCQHVKVNGTQCGSPALRRRKYCFFHQQWRQQHINLRARPQRKAVIDLPVLEDANSIQMTITQVMRLILSKQIDSKDASLLLYALQTASSNLRRTQFEPPHCEDVVIDPRDVPDTPLGEDLWDKEDFEEEECEPDEEELEEGEEENGEGKPEIETPKSNVAPKRYTRVRGGWLSNNGCFIEDDGWGGDPNREDSETSTLTPQPVT